MNELRALATDEPNPGLNESSSGPLFPVTPILDELHRRGHEITLRTLASQVPLIGSAG
jgi:UDP:flavonoid glycosyltransferase YjiC (YdhE family)